MMNKNFRTINIPQLGTNDTVAVLIEKVMENNSFVDKDQVLCVLETTKATVDVISDMSGYIFYLHDIGNEINSGDPIALIADTIDDLSKQSKDYIRIMKENNSTKSDPKATKKAFQLAKN